MEISLPEQIIPLSKCGGSKQAGVYDNTLIILSDDNGHPLHAGFD